MTDRTSKDSIVQLQHTLLDASAGTGKTSELVKRTLQAYLAVSTPDQVLDLTFTNKAASEMRQRIISELKNADLETFVESTHEKEMRSLATKVLARDKALGWDILKNPNQLEIKTFDSLCSSIVSQVPLTSKVGGAAVVADNPTSIYKLAADELLRDYKKDCAWSSNVRRLLQHVNHNFETASSMLVELLGSRDQWLPIILEAKNTAERRAALEKNNLKLLNVIFTPFIRACKEIESEIIQVIEYAYSNAVEPLREALKPLVGVSILPETVSNHSDLTIYQSLLDYFVSKSGRPSFYKKLNKTKGFPAITAFKESEQKSIAEMHNENAKEVIQYLQDSNLQMWLPAMCKANDYRFCEQEWELLDSLISLLPLLAARLLLVFKNTGRIDFVQMAASASAALGEIDSPTNLALKLDNKYKHILVDEFQDCNLTQVELLTKLTFGWEKGDGRSMFLVGDKKQSIYMFRGSNVSVFSLVAINGINEIKFNVRRLENNFRSQACLVGWINDVFEPAFGCCEDIVTGATRFHPSFARKAPLEGSPVEVELFDERGGLVTEASYICQQIDLIKEMDPAASIAVLARTRNDLSAITEAFRDNDVGHRAVDIHKLSRQASIIDLTVLTRSVSHVADRTAWIGLLRSPMVGLSIGELELVVKGERGYVTPGELIIDLLQNDTIISQLQKGSQTRIKKLLRVIEQSIGQLERKTLSDIVKGAYYELNGLSTLKSEAELKNIDAFFKMLRKFDSNGFELELFENEIDRLYAIDQKSTGSVSIMTIHKAKGLEFDYVFVPGSHKSIRGDTARLIDSDTLLSSNGLPTPVVAPSTETGVKESRINEMIRGFSKVKKSLEAVRTAYVALTRAKKKMFITGLADPKKEELRFAGTSILAIINNRLPEGLTVGQGGEMSSSDTRPKRTIIANVITPPLPENNVLAQYRGLTNVCNEVLPEFDWCRDINRCTGVVLHQALEDMAKHGIDSYFKGGIEHKRAKYSSQFKQLGLNVRLIHKAIQKLEHQLSYLQKDDTIYWLLQPRPSSETEVGFILKDGGKRKLKRIDHTFVDDGVRYFFDFKTSEPNPGEGTSKFVARMLSQYERKMKQYRQCFPNEKYVRGGLYLTSINLLAWYDRKALKAA
ncbi:UvrD-helicase domain-containing protein [Salinimonas sp. HHU 13199]|uniref:DNA 3'-5' helicase n=1 Tax=Salinimonas profundi TaxID=2729140 RepID=A0ABR8LM13_9ALTE|nr:UvrD-helicase domain-containing protein [Salinimonas profundi]MBD3587237.1 UvrD-helicase domain-containing protein [Salinimonas profundi]